MKKFLLFIISLIFSFNTNASHLMGGEITWECIKSGPNTGYYIFNVKIYRDCQGVPLADVKNTSLVVHNHPLINSISLNYLG